MTRFLRRMIASFSRRLPIGLLSPEAAAQRLGLDCEAWNQAREAQKAILDRQTRVLSNLEARQKQLHNALETQHGQLFNLCAGFEMQKTQLEAIEKEFDRQGHALRALEYLLLLKEIHPDLIRIITRLPKFSPVVLNDFYNRFAWYDPCAKSIRHWSGDIVASVISSNKSLDVDEQRSLALNNLDRTADTARYPKALVEYISLLATGHVDRLPAETILPECRRLLREESTFHEEFRIAWFHYCTLLLETREEEEAGRLAKKWIEHFGTECFWQFLPLAHFIRGFGITDERIEKAALIWESYLKRAGNGPSFVELIQDRSVAIVGNGPQGVGLGQGREIDAHDLVIRFNRYRINENTAPDYGRKTDICFTNPIYFDPPDDLTALEAIFFIHDFGRACWITEDGLERMLAYVRAGKIWFHFGDIAHAFTPLHRKISSEAVTIVNRPTSGYIMAVTMKSLMPNFSMEHLYGFSCKSEHSFTLESGYHYDADDPEETISLLNAMNLRHSLHDYEMERRALRMLFLGEKTPQAPEEARR